MAVTDQQYNNVLRRLDALEGTTLLMMQAMTGLADLDQLRQLLVIRQTEIEDLQARMIAQENETEALRRFHKV